MSGKDDETYAEYRRRRVQRLKKIIVGFILTLIIIPLVTAIVFICLYVSTKHQLTDLQNQYNELLSAMEQLKDATYDSPQNQDVYSVSPIVESERDTEISVEPEDEVDELVDRRLVYLTFDDGPSSNTDEILDILAKYNVKATFFVVGKDDEVSVAAYKRIVEEGHTLAMHSYSHRYSQIYASKEAFAQDFDKLQEYLYDVTGVWSRYYRFPGGSSNTASKVDMKELISYLDEQDIIYYDWNIVSGDAVSKILSADAIYENCISKVPKYNEAVILMHDAAAKHTTVEALPRLIEAIQDMDNTVIVPITDDTIPVQHQ